MFLLLRRPGGLLAGDAAEGGADRHPDAGGVALAQHVAGHHFPGDEQITAGLTGEMDGGGVVDVEPEVGEGDPRTQGVAVVRRRIDGARPVGFRRREARGRAVIQAGVIELARRAGGIIVGDGLR